MEELGGRSGRVFGAPSCGRALATVPRTLQKVIVSTHRKNTARAFTPLRILIALALSLLVLPVTAAPALAAGPTTIEVDGNQDGDTNDWEGWQGSPNGNLAEGFSVIRDGVGNGDGTGIDGQEDWNNGEGSEQPWTANKATASGKSDVGNVLIDSYRSGTPTHLFAVVGFDRGNGSGTQRYYLEFNQAEHTSLNPVRTAGDLRVILAVNGNGLEECQGAQRWLAAGGWGPAGGCTGNIDFAVNKAPIKDYFGSPYLVDGKIPTNQFFEVSIDLTNLGATSCPVAGFRTFNMRTQEGNENGENGQLKDVIRGAIDIPSDCGTLKIEKRDVDTGQLVGEAGTVFRITPDPTAGSSSGAAKYVIDNNVSKPDGYLTDSDSSIGKVTITNVDPDTYKVEEVTPPAGYLLPPAPADLDKCPASGEWSCLKQTVTAPGGGSNQVTFVFWDKKIWAAPKIYKTANAQFGKSYAWTIRKTVAVEGQDPATDDPATPADESGRASTSISQGGSAKFDYDVTVVGTESTSGHQVTGGVRVVNPNNQAMTVTLTDSILNGNGGIPCSFNEDTDGGAYEVSVPPSTDDDDDGNLDGTVYLYTCSLTIQQVEGDIDTNRATVTWSLADYPQASTPDPWAPNPTTASASATATFTFSGDPATVSNDTVVVSDTFDGDAEFGGPKTITFGEYVSKLSQDGTVYTVSWSYSKTFSGDPVGRCTEHPNTATLDQAVGPDLTDTAVATVCVGGGLTITKNVVTSLTRSYAYTIDKQASASTVNVDPVTGKATVGYTVAVTEGAATDSDWLMSGKITVTNPNNQPVTLTSITDRYGATTCSVVAGDKVVPAEDYQAEGTQGQRVFDYTCSFGSTKPPYDAANLAEITWDKTALASSTDTASYSVQMTPSLWEGVDVARDDVTSTLTKDHPTVTVVDDKTVSGQSVTLGTITWSGIGKTHTFTYSLQLQGSAGRCVPYTNTASIRETVQSDSATVTVCWPVSPSVSLSPGVSKTVTGTYDRTYLWAIEKEADQTSVDTNGLTGTAVNYTVTATPDGYVDHGWAMSGTITVSNPNDYQWTSVDITDVPDVGGGATCTVINGDDVAVPAGTLVNGQIVPGTVTRSYTCTVPQQPLYTGGTNTATVTWAGGTVSSDAVPVVFAVSGETDEVVTVVDDKTVQGDEIELGEAVWSDGGEPTVFTYSLELEAEANECADYVNTAQIVETGQFVDVTVEACGPEVLPAEVIVPRTEPEVQGVGTVLPATGGPHLGLTWAALAMLLAGGALITSSRMRRAHT